MNEVQPIADRVAQNLEIISNHFRNSTRRTRLLMGFIIYYLVLVVNPIGRLMVRWKDFRNNLEIPCHPICNGLYVLRYVLRYVHEHEWGQLMNEVCMCDVLRYVHEHEWGQLTNEVCMCECSMWCVGWLRHVITKACHEVPTRGTHMTYRIHTYTPHSCTYLIEFHIHTSWFASFM